jgi:ABC-type phosphate/phosphonate transport system substrate-binding protein
VDCTPEKFFASVVRHNNVEDALDDVVRGVVEAVIVDGLSLECYNVVKPGCMDRLRTVEKSAQFPAAVVAYREGTLDRDTLNRFRKGMLDASKNPKSRGLMTLWKLTSFEPVPADYPQVLNNIRQVYPAPSAFVIKTPESTETNSRNSD